LAIERLKEEGKGRRLDFHHKSKPLSCANRSGREKKEKGRKERGQHFRIIEERGKERRSGPLLPSIGSHQSTSREGKGGETTYRLDLRKKKGKKEAWGFSTMDS